MWLTLTSNQRSVYSAAELKADQIELFAEQDQTSIA